MIRMNTTIIFQKFNNEYDERFVGGIVVLDENNE